METGLRRPLLPPCKAQPEGDAGERARGAACMGEVRGAGMHGEGGAEKRTRGILSGVWYHFIEKVLDLM